MTPKLAMVGEGAIASIHMKALEKTDAEITVLVYGERVAGEAFAAEHGIASATADYDAALEDVDGVVIASPSAVHAEQGRSAIAAGRHALVEIPIGLSLAECEALAAAHLASDRVVMACHTRRFSPAHRHVKSMIEAGTFSLQHLVAETYFLRREHLNMFGHPRTWVDSLLWHHAAHSIDLFIWLTGDEAPQATALAGPPHPELGCAMDVTIALRAGDGALMTLAMSFNNDGPFGGFYRYIGDTGTFHAFRDELQDAERQPIALTGDAFADQDAAFVRAIVSGSRASPSPADVLPCMRVIDQLAATVPA